jgi:hypothetical protein
LSAPDFWHHPLWQRRHGSAYWRFAKLQAAIALGRREPCPPLDGGAAEFKDRAFAIPLLRQDDFFMNVGATLGSYPLLATGERFAFSSVIIEGQTEAANQVFPGSGLCRWRL